MSGLGRIAGQTELFCQNFLFVCHNCSIFAVPMFLQDSVMGCQVLPGVEPQWNIGVKQTTMHIEDVQRMKQRFRIIGNAPELNRAIDVAMQVAPTDLSVLITGESGSGKDVFPKIIHENSLRKNKKYLAVNCGAIPEGTIDSELFGHVKGSFTNAFNDRNGYFSEADGGTIFLDEVAELPLSTQARLLRVLESGEYIRVGSSTVEKTNVRIVAATNADLMKAIEDGRFREDLYYRLSTIPVKVPPLRERGNDMVLLFRKFASDCAQKYQMPEIHLTDDAKQQLVAYHWPGNVRQLKNVTEQISIMSPGAAVTAEMLQDYLPDRRSSMLPVMVGGGTKSGNSFENEREILYKVLFDLRHDVTELKAQVEALSQNAGNAQPSQVQFVQHPDSTYQPVVRAVHVVSAPDQFQTPESFQAAQPVHNYASGQSFDRGMGDIQDTEVYVEETLSINDAEKELIRKALVRHGGKRKNAAQDLKISERTLYRKIKEYGLE